MYRLPKNGPGSGSATSKGLILGALGVVFGDIGTSPLYAFEAVFSGSGLTVAASEANVLGILSLFVWALMFIVTLKYVLVVMRFDNCGEGGIVALMTLLLDSARARPKLRRFFIPLGLLGAALFYGDGVITPAISVVSAIEGLETISPDLSRFVVPVSLVVLIGLFVLQCQGVARISKLFGPVMLLWFIVIGALGLNAIYQMPAVLAALNPWHAFTFIIENPNLSFMVLGAVVLCLTGAEALYADMGHFGASPIQRAWIFLVFPALVLNYLGQGALVLTHPDDLNNPFFRMAPGWALHALVVLATFATVIASQAVISGVFSMTQQLVQLRAIPRMLVLHTSESHRGHVYVPAANWLLLILVVLVVMIFQSSNAMAGAYGIAVTGTMIITDLFLVSALVYVSGWNKGLAFSVVASFLVVDSLFFAANLTKLSQGGWFPVLLSLLIVAAMAIWRHGIQTITKHEAKRNYPLPEFVNELAQIKPYRSVGTAVCLVSDTSLTSPILEVLAKHLHAVPTNVIYLRVEVLEVPFVTQQERWTLQPAQEGLNPIVLHFGYSDQIDIPGQLSKAFPEIEFTQNCSYLINRWDLWLDDKRFFGRWYKHIFIFLFRNAAHQSRIFQLPPDQVIEVSRRVML